MSTGADRLAVEASQSAENCAIGDIWARYYVCDSLSKLSKYPPVSIVDFHPVPTHGAIRCGTVE